MSTATDKERFEAAVKIITGLPKDGPFQPSNDMKLKFYGLFKQATIGPCTSSQPAFWDIVNRAKWGAWKALGDMPPEEAMRNYVEILKQVVETMTLDANVQDFLEKMGPIYEFVTDDGRVVSKAADINSTRPDAKALAMLDIAKGATGGGGKKIANGSHADKNKPINGNAVANGRSPNHISSEESDLDDELDGRQQQQHLQRQERPRKIDLEAGSEEEEFDDATDNQNFGAVSVEIIPIQSSGSHSPLSYDSSPRRSSKGNKSIDNAIGNRDRSLVIDRSAGISRSLTVDRSSGIDQSIAIDQLSPSRRQAATALGQLLKQLPELNSSDQNDPRNRSEKIDTTESGSLFGGSSPEDSIVRAWSVLRRIHSEQVQRAQDDDDWLLRRLKHMKKTKSGHRKHRGRGGHSDGSGNGNGNGNGGENGGGDASGGAPPNASDQSNSANQPTSSRRSQRQLSGESGSTSSSSGADSANLDFDPHVGAVLLRMHRELQHINRQLELVEGILVTQQHMIRNVIVKAEQAQVKKMRLGFFSNLPWRTILFILAWPVVVNVVVRLCFFRMRRRR